MRVSLIVAMDRNGVIGVGGKLPWRLPADLRRFRQITMGKPIVMGRRTHESIGRPLPERENIVVTRDRGFRAPGCTVVHSLDEMFRHCRDAEEIMVMGGAELYQQLLPRADRMYLTEVHAEVAGETRFPAWNREDWREISREDFRADGANQHSYSFLVLEKTIRQGPPAPAPSAGPYSADGS
jgi:dihydrofolate reductase